MLPISHNAVIRAAFTCALLLAFTPLACAQLQTGLTVEHGGRERVYDLYVPGGLGNQPVPLVVDMHGWSQTPEQQRDLSGFRQLAGQEKFIVAWPEGVALSWNGLFGGLGPDDVGALRAIVADIADRANIDPRRIYATGWSNGGDMAYRLACDANDLFAAFAAVAGGIATGTQLHCSPARPVPVISFRGFDDNVVPYAGGQVFGADYSILSADTTHNFWVNRSQCQGQTQRENLGNAWCDYNNNCADGVRVESCITHGGGHETYNNSDGVDVARRAWDFMKAYTAPESAGSNFIINPGVSDAWFNDATAGQGLLVVVFEETGIVFLAWFTYDTERPDDSYQALLGEIGHRWVTAQGPYDGDTATLTVYLTQGGVFDKADPPAVTDTENPIGTITIVWQDCENATLSYDLDPPGVMGEMALRRIVPDNVALCEALAGQ